MIGYIKGKIVHRGSNFLIVATDGVGYRVYVGAEVLHKKSVELFVYHYIREGVSELFGFEDAGDLEIFELLLGVSGVGPRVALSLVSQLNREKILAAIQKGDPALFKTVSGVGNKVAAKIIVELKSKIADGDLSGVLTGEDETVEALVALGYRRGEIIPYLRDLPDELETTSEKIKYVLKNVGRKKSR